MNNTAEMIEAAAAQLARTTDGLAFSGKVAYTYNPLIYAWAPHAEYIRRYANGPREILLVGMNPGPWGMAQTGVPFGEIQFVRDWMQIETAVGQPEKSHPKKPIDGFACTRSEVSGRRLWSLMQERFGPAENFFKHHYVANYCPLVFMEAGGKNLTPDKLPKPEQDALFAACNSHLIELIHALQPAFIIGVGKFAAERIQRAYSLQQDKETSAGPVIDSILHPSPASPQANKGWGQQAASKLIELGAWTTES
ncbi:MAG: single-stranded DNA-binding protein [Spirochaetia bacterium]|nr:single-stranded DNA-binding protein [Spirochaetia bacterium]